MEDCTAVGFQLLDQYHSSGRNLNDLGSLSPVRTSTVQLVQLYGRCNPSFSYVASYNPRRALTKPSQGVSNFNYDNVNNDLILIVHDVLGLPSRRYVVVDLLGSGTFGQVAKCRNMDTGTYVAVKVVKNRPAYLRQCRIEAEILTHLNTHFDCEKSHILTIVDSFMDRNHMCLVMEMLSVNLFELLKQNQFRGLSCNLVQIFTKQLVEALQVTQSANVIHCDMKPENIMLISPKSTGIKLIDFGSACFENQTLYSYIQSRYYRSPEVILGLPYQSAIDIWSLGCITAELFLGLPLFPGQSEFNQLQRITNMLGAVPDSMVELGRHKSKYFVEDPESGAYRIKTMHEFELDAGVRLEAPKRYFSFDTLPELIHSVPFRKNLSDDQTAREREQRRSLLDFLMGVLRVDPRKRWTAQEASGHPFITGEPFRGKYEPRRSKRLSTHSHFLVEQAAHTASSPLSPALSSSSVSPMASSSSPVGSTSSPSSSRGGGTASVATPTQPMSRNSSATTSPMHAASSGAQAASAAVPQSSANTISSNWRSRQPGGGATNPPNPSPYRYTGHASGASRNQGSTSSTAGVAAGAGQDSSRGSALRRSAAVEPDAESSRYQRRASVGSHGGQHRRRAKSNMTNSFHLQ